jgi:hypothetical protein
MVVCWLDINWNRSSHMSMTNFVVNVFKKPKYVLEKHCFGLNIMMISDAYCFDWVVDFRLECSLPWRLMLFPS